MKNDKGQLQHFLYPNNQVMEQRIHPDHQKDNHYKRRKRQKDIIKE